MFDIQQFRTTLYFLLILGVTGFALAAQAPGMWILATGGILVNAWLVKTGRFTSMPRILANVVTLAALLLAAQQMRSGDTTPILTVGNFIVVLHLVKLFEQRANRDYAQLLVLSLLLMVAAAISTASLLFGIIFIVYMFLSLHCCLLFHLKVEVDQAREAYQQPADQLNPALLKQDQQDLPSSMRRLTALISTAGIAMAVLVFLFFPRGAGQSMFGPLQPRAAQAMTGFNDEVSFEKVAQIARNDDVVARVELYHRGEKVTQPTQMLLRGSVLDSYTGNDASRGMWQWYRSDNSRFGEPQEALAGSTIFLGADSPASWKQVVNLQPTGTNKLFAIAGPASISPAHDMQIRFSPSDDVLESRTTLVQPVSYEVASSGELPTAETAADPAAQSVIDPAIAGYVRQAAVSGVDAEGRPLAEYPVAGNHAYDHQIAANIERYLRANFTYTMDLTNIGALGDRDPMAAFLTDFKKGHCEYFAGAMTLMCQSLRIPARFVVGFRCEPEDFNTIGDYFVVKQSNAHAWCEVFTGQKWETFDPTSGHGAAGDLNHPLFSQMKKLFDYLEFKWATTVVAYDTGDRRNLIANLDWQVSRTAANGSLSLQDWIDGFQKQIASPTVLSCVITGMISLGVCFVVWFLIERWRLRRRVKRIGIELLPTPDQFRLVRQLGFYNDLLRILERHHIVRPRQMTPLEFSRSLAYLPAHVYDDIYRLTELFYRIRYGPIRHPAHPRRHLAGIVHRIQQTLEATYRAHQEHISP
jgi:transglutaminase-like putative cysteine protease